MNRGLWYLTPEAREAYLEFIGEPDRPLVFPCPSTAEGAAVARAASAVGEVIVETMRRGVPVSVAVPLAKLKWPEWPLQLRKRGPHPDVNTQSLPLVWVSVGEHRWPIVIDFARDFDATQKNLGI